VFQLEPSIRGLPATRDQVMLLHQSINSPHVAIPGKPAGPAQAYIVGLRVPQGFGIFIYLYLADAEDCAVYVFDRRNLKPEDFAAVEAEAMGFVESMGFFMDTLNFRGLPPDDQEELMKSLPVFQRELTRTAARPSQAASPTTSLARFFAAF
jgi:hypothetical protein